MFRKSVLSHIDGLDPAADCCEIMRLLAGQEFPWDYQRSLIDMVFVRSLAAPRIAGLISAHGYMQKVPQKRYDDTAIMIIEFVKEGYDSERGRRVLARMNEIHSRFKIRNDDYLYILTALMVQPVRWNAQFGWRRMVEKEREANHWFWREVGVRMGLTDIPEGYDASERFNREYEEQWFRRTAVTVELSSDLFGLLETWVPSFVRPVVRPGMSTLLDDAVLDHFGMPHPPAWLRAVAISGLKARARAMQWLPAGRRPWFFVDGKIRSYPHGYEVEDLGPPADWKPPRRSAASAQGAEDVGPPDERP